MTGAVLRIAFGVLACTLLAVAYVPLGSGALPRASDSPSVSSNWAGYVATGPGSTAMVASPSMAYSDVTGQWVEPTATCSGVPTSVAVWVGLGGYSVNSTKLEQAGTSADCSANGTASYYAWYELVPADSVNIDLKIFPGDVIASSVVINGSEVLVQITDRTRRTRFTRHLTMNAPDVSSAEWIAEAPAECMGSNACQQFALTDFDSVTFTRTYAIGNTVPGTITDPTWTATAMELVPSAHRFFGASFKSTSDALSAGASPLALSPDGNGFTIDWEPSAG